jgi:predicted phosphodiesterase
MTGMVRAQETTPFFFIQLSDPQFGMFAKNADFQHETANFEFAVASVNRLKPAFVIVTGDLSNTRDESQIAEYLRLTAKIDRSIPCYHVPGNHDLGNEPTAESLAAYQAHFGPDHYSFRHGRMMGLVLDSPLMWARKCILPQAEEQRQWLKSELEKAKQEGASPVIVFQHHPWFAENIDDRDSYENIPLAVRRPCLDLLRQYGVTHVFTGHYHANLVNRYASLELVTTGAIGKPLRKDVSGMRIVVVRGGNIEHRFYHLGEIPHQIELSPAKKP